MIKVPCFHCQPLHIFSIFRALKALEMSNIIQAITSVIWSMVFKTKSLFPEENGNNRSITNGPFELRGRPIRFIQG